MTFDFVVVDFFEFSNVFFEHDQRVFFVHVYVTANEVNSEEEGEEGELTLQFGVVHEINVVEQQPLSFLPRCSIGDFGHVGKDVFESFDIAFLQRFSFFLDEQRTRSSYDLSIEMSQPFPSSRDS